MISINLSKEELVLTYVLINLVKVDTMRTGFDGHGKSAEYKSESIVKVVRGTRIQESIDGNETFVIRI